LFEVLSDEEDMVSSKVPEWAQGNTLVNLIISQFHKDPDRIFGVVQPIALTGTSSLSKVLKLLGWRK
jgi:hypothetical protein